MRTRSRSGRWVGAAAALLVIATVVLLLVRHRSPDRSAESSAAPAESTATAPASPASPAPGPRAPDAVAPATRLPIRVPPASPASPDDLPGSFEGHVVARNTGAGIPGADLTFSRAGAAASVRAGPDGAFRFAPPADGRWLLAAVTAPGYFPFAPEWGHSPVQLDARAGTHVRGIEVHLVPARPIQGEVVDQDDRPVAAAEVRLRGTAGEAALVPIADRFSTDARGAFTFAAPEGAVLEARKEGFAPGRAVVSAIALLNGRITVRLGPPRDRAGVPAPIGGRVVGETGTGVAGALVLAAREGPFGPSELAAAQTVSGTDGAFSLDALDPGNYRVTARADGHAPASARRIQPGETDVVLALRPGGRLAGCVRDVSSGTAVAPFTVLVFDRRSPVRRILQQSRSVVDPAGCYALDDLRPGPVAVVISAPGFAPSDELRVEVPEPPGEATADVALEAGARLIGVVVDDASRRPLAGARIQVEGALSDAASTFPVLSEATTDAAGRFALRGLPRRFSISVAAAGHHARVTGGFDAPSGTEVGPVEIALRATAPGEAPRTDLAGIGVALSAHGDGVAITQVHPQSGAAEAGLASGDTIVRVNGTPVAELGFAGVVDAIRGPEGTTVTLTLRRGDGETVDVRVARRLVRG